MSSITRAFGRMTLNVAARCSATDVLSFRSLVARQPSLQVRQQNFAQQATGGSVVAKQNTLRRQRRAEKARIYNKQRKSAVRTRSSKVLRMLEGMMVQLPKTEEELAPVEKLIGEAFKEIDKAVVKGVLHSNTGNRKKSRISLAKNKVAAAAGFYQPKDQKPAEQPEPAVS